MVPVLKDMRMNAVTAQSNRTTAPGRDAEERSFRALTRPTGRTVARDVQPIAVRRRLHLGDIAVDIRTFPRQRPVQITVRPNMVALVITLDGRSEMIGHSFQTTLMGDTAVLLARAGQSNLVWSSASRGLVLHIPRSHLQILASKRLEGPVRLAMIDLTLALPSRDKALGAVLAEIAREGSGPIGITPDRALNLASYLRESLIETLVALPKYGTLFLAARSVNRAIAYIQIG